MGIGRVLEFSFFYWIIRKIMSVVLIMIVLAVVWGWFRSQGPSSATSAIGTLTRAGLSVGHDMRHAVSRAQALYHTGMADAAMPAFQGPGFMREVVSGGGGNTVYFDFGDGSSQDALQRLAVDATSSGVHTICFTNVQNRPGCASTRALAPDNARKAPVIITARGDIAVPEAGVASGFVVFNDAGHAQRMLNTLGQAPGESSSTASPSSAR